MADVFLKNAATARSLAQLCREEALEHVGERRTYWLSEADRHDERADWYEQRSFTPAKTEQRDAA